MNVLLVQDLQDLNYDGALSVAESALDGLDPGQIIAFESMDRNASFSEFLLKIFSQLVMNRTIISHSHRRRTPPYGRFVFCIDIYVLTFTPSYAALG